MLAGTFLPDVVRSAARSVVVVEPHARGPAPGDPTFGGGVFLGSGTVGTLQAIAFHGTANLAELRVRVRYGAEPYEAELSGMREEYRVASLNVPALTDGIAPERRPSRTLEVGEPIWVVGRTFDGAIRFSEGRISLLQLARTLHPYERHYFVFTTATGWERSAGAGIFDGFGRLVGMVMDVGDGANVAGLPADALRLSGSLRLAQVLSRGEKRRESRAMLLQHAMLGGRNDPETWCALAEVLSGEADEEDVKAALENALALDPDNAWAREELGILHQQLGRVLR
jgi:hypothetical protein